MSFVFQKGDRIGVQLMNDNKLMDVELFQSLYDTVVIGKTIDQVADRLQTAPHNIAANRPDPVIQAKLAKSIRDAGYPQPESLECGSDNCHMRGKSEDVNSPFVSHKCRGCAPVRSEHTGNKYHRQIRPVIGNTDGTVVDVYCVIEAFAVSCPARQHALKKILCSGIRGKNDSVQDLIEARDAVERAITLERQRLKAGE